MKLLLAGLCALLMLGGCGGMPIGAGIQNTELERFTRDDLNRAIRIAEKNGDTVAVGCYTQVRDYYTPECVPPEGATECAPEEDLSPIGVFSAHATARQIARQASIGMPEALKVACAPLIVDMQAFTLRRILD